MCGRRAHLGSRSAAVRNRALTCLHTPPARLQITGQGDGGVDTGPNELCQRQRLTARLLGHLLRDWDASERWRLSPRASRLASRLASLLSRLRRLALCRSYTVLRSIRLLALALPPHTHTLARVVLPGHRPAPPWRLSAAPPPPTHMRVPPRPASRRRWPASQGLWRGAPAVRRALGPCGRGGRAASRGALSLAHCGVR